jgi:c-di-AMP phosphodiesterase-like protein
MNDDNKIVKNLKIGKYIIMLTNFVAAIIFFLVYLSLKNIAVLIVVILLILVSVFIFVYFSKIEQKYTPKNPDDFIN